MTTSGLYGTVVGLNDDDTVQLAIAPGVEVKWALAALATCVAAAAGRSRDRRRSDEPSEATRSERSGRDPPRSHEGTERACRTFFSVSVILTGANSVLHATARLGRSTAVGRLHAVARRQLTV